MTEPVPPVDATRYALGVDGGGTKTEAWLARLGEAGQTAVLGRGLAGPSNPRAVGTEIAFQNLGEAVDAAFRDTQVDPVDVDCAVLAISGSGRPAMREKIAAWANSRGLAHMLGIVHDADPVLVAGTPDGWGVALIVGTGSAAIAVDLEGNRHVVGGWGYWFGDEGSAYWIGRRALQAVARAADGRGPATALTAAIAERLQIDDPRAMLAALEQSGNARGAIAAVAETVAKAAAAGDETALGIVDAAAQELAALVVTAARKLDLGTKFPLALTGGAVCGSELLRERLLAAIAAHSIKPYPVDIVRHPVAGCLILALQMLETGD
jgi:N-acetylglucosamine kinase-like BadF-type ATPase